MFSFIDLTSEWIPNIEDANIFANFKEAYDYVDAAYYNDTEEIIYLFKSIPHFNQNLINSSFNYNFFFFINLNAFIDTEYWSFDARKGRVLKYGNILDIRRDLPYGFDSTFYSSKEKIFYAFRNNYVYKINMEEVFD